VPVEMGFNRRRRVVKGMKKTFVLDTNVLLHNAESIESFADNEVIVPMAVIEELDKFKTHNDELGRNARQVIRRIDGLRANGANLRDGVPLSNGGLLKIVSAKAFPNEIGLESDVADNLILRIAYGIHRQGNVVIFVSKDINARLKADALGIQAEDFEKQKINFDELYTGYSEQKVANYIVDSFFESTVLEEPGLGRHPNEFISLIDESNEKHTALAKVAKPGTLKHLSKKYDMDKILNIFKREKIIKESKDWPDLKFGRPKDTKSCPGGYKGRIGIFEVLEVTETIKELINKERPSDEIQKQAEKENMITMLEDGLIKAVQKITSIEEVFRVIREE